MIDDGISDICYIETSSKKNLALVVNKSLCKSRSLDPWLDIKEK